MAELKISNTVAIPLSEVDMEAVRAQGAGGQNVNKVSTAIHLRFDIDASSLPEHYKERLKTLNDQRVSGEGVIVIKAQRFRSQDKNREDALARLQALVKSVTVTRKKRKPTKPSRTSQRKRMDRKTRHGNLKSLRGKVKY
jgi:ribosome-associated protein